MAHTFVASIELTPSAVDPITWSCTCGAGTTVLVLTLGHAGSRTGTPTYNGINLTQADSTRGVTECFAELWYLLDPPTGVSYTLSIPNSGKVAARGDITTFAAQSGYHSVLDVATGNADTSANPSLAPSASIAGDVMVEILGDGYRDVPSGRTHTALHSWDYGLYVVANQYGLIASAGTVTAGFTITSDDWGMVCALFKEEAPSGSVLKTFNGLAKASVKVVNGLAIASVSKWDGLA